MFGANLHGDTGVIGFWYPRRMCVFGVRAVDIDSASYGGKHPHGILYQHERRKKGKYIESFLERRHNFMSRVLEVDGVMGNDTNV